MYLAAISEFSGRVLSHVKVPSTFVLSSGKKIVKDRCTMSGNELGPPEFNPHSLESLTVAHLQDSETE